MAITILATSGKNILNNANASEIASMLQKIRFGDFVRGMPIKLVKKNVDTMVASLHDLATVDSIVLPDDAKANTIVRAYARATAAAGTLGELAAQAFGTTPADAQIAVSPSGNIVLLAASRYTDVDVEYIPERQDILEMTLPVVAASGVLTLPSTLNLTPLAAGQTAIANGYASLLEAEVTVGGVLGKRIVLVPGAANPATGNARFNLAKTVVQFTIADAVTQARVKLGVAPGTDLDAILTLASEAIG